MFIVDEQGNIELYQGDSGTLVIEDLPTDKSYTVYFAIYNSKRNPIGYELYIQANYASPVVISIPANLTDLLTVPRNDDTAEYYYGLKLCDGSNDEDTLAINDGDFGDLNTITVYPKKVEGLV